MAKALLVCFKNAQLKKYQKFVEEVTKRLAPNNGTINTPYSYSDEHIFSFLFNPTPTVKREGPSLCLGMSDGKEKLFTPNTPLPEGSYSLFRVGKEAVEVATDYAASRTTWYYYDDDKFITATSQRLIIAFLGNLDFNEKACGWLLSSGTLGPGLSWDKRIKMMYPRMRLLLNRKTWEVTVDEATDFNFERSKKDVKSESAYKRQLEDAVAKSIAQLQINVREWTLALSGGMDSRSVLYHLEKENLETITWGLQAANDIPDTDAVIGKQLATHVGVKHQYAALDYQQGSFPQLMDRFTCASEGRIDHYAGYLDALDLWGKLSASGRGVIRGYDAFGRKPPVKTPYQVRHTCNLVLSSDYNSAHIPKILRIGEEDIPEALRQQEGESLGDWRDRLWLIHRTPTTTAALEDIKLSYVEIVNPLLSRKVVKTVQELPLDLRSNKKIWKSIVLDLFPEIPIARREAVQEVGQVLALPEVKAFICGYLAEQEDTTLFPKEFLDVLIANYSRAQGKHLFRRKVRRFIIAYLPKWLENKIRGKVGARPINYQVLASRSVIALKMRKMLTEDMEAASLISS